MPRPRILSSYNYKGRETIKKEGDGGSSRYNMKITRDKMAERDCEIIMINEENKVVEAEKKLESATKASLTNEVRDDNKIELTDTEKWTSNLPLETKQAVNALCQNSSLSLHLVTNKSGKVAQSATHSSANVVCSAPVLSTNVFQLVSDSSNRIRRSTSDSSGTHLLKVPRSSSNPSVRLGRFPADSSSIQTRSEANASKGLGEVLSNSYKKVSAVSTNSTAQVIRSAPKTLEKTSPVLSNSSKSSTRVVEIGANSVQESPGKLAQLSSNKVPKLTSQTSGMRNNSNIMMVLPVSKSNGRILKNATTRRLEKIENTEEIKYVRRVVGVQRQKFVSGVDFTQRNVPLTRKIVQSSDMRQRSSRQSVSGGTTKSQKVTTKVHRVPSSEEKSQEKKYFAQDDNTLNPISNKAVHDVTKKKDEYGKEHKSSNSTKDNNANKNFVNKIMRKSTRSSVSAIRVDERNSVRPSRENKPQLPPLVRIQDNRIKKDLPNLDLISRNKWRTRCIICHEGFTDMYELHRHATLSHPGIRIVFCELCTSSFRTDDELYEHRFSYHKITSMNDMFDIKAPNTKMYYNHKKTMTKLMKSDQRSSAMRNDSQHQRTKIKEEDDEGGLNLNALPKNELSKFEPVAGHSRSNENLRGRLPKKKIAGSNLKSKNLKKYLHTGPSMSSIDTRGRRPQAKNRTEKLTYNYVDVDVIRHEAIATKNKFKCAEIRQLIVPLTRLEGPELEKYLKKLSAKPVYNSMTTRSKNSKILSNSNNKPGFLRSSGVNQRSEKQPSGLISGNIRKTRRPKRLVYAKEKNYTISHEAETLNSNSQNGRPEPRRSMRRRLPKKSIYSESDETTDNNSIKNRWRNDDNIDDKSLAKVKLQDIEDVTVDVEISSDEDMLEDKIEIGEMDKVAEIVKEQRVIRKLVSRSSISSSASLGNNRDKNDSNSEKRLTTDDPDTESSCSRVRKRSHSNCTSSDEKFRSNYPISTRRQHKCHRPLRLRRSTPRLKKLQKLSIKEPDSHSSEEMSSGEWEKFHQSRTSPIKKPESINSEQRLSNDNLKSETSLSLTRKNSLQRKSSKSATTSKKCDEIAAGMSDGKDGKDVKVVIEKAKNASQGNEAEEKIDDEDKIVNKKIDGSDNLSREDANDSKKQGEETGDEKKQPEERPNPEKEEKPQEEMEYQKTETQTATNNEKKCQKDDEKAKPLEEKIDTENEVSKDKTNDVETNLSKGEKNDESEQPAGNSDEEGQPENVESIDDKDGNEKQSNEEANSGENQAKEKINDTENPRDINDEKNESKEKGNAEAKKIREKDDTPEHATSEELFETRTRRTYSSSTKFFDVVKKFSQRGRGSESEATKAQGLCIMCKELFTLMMKISRRLLTKNNQATPIKCPLCQRYFISMFHLELHVATNHLRCQNKTPCEYSQLSNIKKPWQDSELDCDNEIAVSMECPRCIMTFKLAKDLNHHLITQHEIESAKETSHKELPNYLKDLRTSCFKTIVRENADAISIRKRALLIRVNNKPKLNGSSSEILKSATKQSSLVCFLCPLKFSKITEYIRHVREIHHSRIQTFSNQNKQSEKSVNDTNRSLYKKDSLRDVVSTSNAEEIYSGQQNIDNGGTADREYLLKQLLSDDSNEDEGIKTSRYQRQSSEATLKEIATENIVEESSTHKIVGFVSSQHTCDVCKKKYKRAQDLLIHSLSHVETEIPKASKVDVQEKTVDDRQELFGDSLIEHEDDFENLSERQYEEMPLKTNDADDSDNESENIVVVYGCDGSSQKVVIGSKRRANLPPDELPRFLRTDEDIVETKKRKICESKKSPDDSVGSPEERSNSTKNDSIKELMATEVGLADETDEKLPLACEKCNRHFANRSLLNEHLFFLHDDSLKNTVLTDVLTPIGPLRGTDDSQIPRRWHCPLCIQNFKLFQGYSRHRYFVHGDDSLVHVCDNCSKVLTNVTMVNVHICTDMASYNCRICNETFSTGMSLRLHNTEKHLETKGPHVCEPCKKTFLTNSMLRRHEQDKHRLSRPYRARKNSPVRLATPDSTNDDEMKKGSLGSTEEGNKGRSEQLDQNCDENREKNIDSIDEPLQSRRGRWRTCRSKKMAREESPANRKGLRVYRASGKRKRGRPRKYPLSEEESMYSSQDEKEEEKKNVLFNRDNRNDSTLYFEETDLHQCSMCQLYCVSRSALRNHMVKIHSMNDEVCQLCQKMYPAGKLLRHMIDHHIDSDDPEETGLEPSLEIGTNSNEIDAEIFIRMLGFNRLVSMCEYRRYNTQMKKPSSYPCSYCFKTFPSNELYRYHFLLHHDAMCALCNIEYKRGQDAARHKNEIHGSVGRYIWFADRTVTALTSAKNFSEVAESAFFKMLMKDGTEDDDENEEMDNLAEEIETAMETFDSSATQIETVKDREEITYEDDAKLSEDIIKTKSRNEETELITDTSCSKGMVVGIAKQNEPKLAGSSVSLENILGQEEETICTNNSTSADKVTSSITSEREPKSLENAMRTSDEISRIASEEEILADDVEEIPFDDFTEPDDVNLIIVVTDEDLERFNITTRLPNIWGLAAKISSTFDDITPTEVKNMLERYFERQEDFDV